MLDRQFFFKHGPDLVACFRKHTFMDAKDVYGKKFKGYSTEYGKAKRTGKLFRQATEFSNSKAPILTSDLLRDWKMRSTGSSGFKFGTMAHGGKVKHLANMGRVISDNRKPIPDKCAKEFNLLADKYLQRKLNKIKGFKTDIIIGK